MEANWQKGLGKIAVLLMVEILLNLLGLDTLANYSEFLFERKVFAMNYLPELVIKSGLYWFEQNLAKVSGGVSPG